MTGPELEAIAQRCETCRSTWGDDVDLWLDVARVLYGRVERLEKAGWKRWSEDTRRWIALDRPMADMADTMRALPAGWAIGSLEWNPTQKSASVTLHQTDGGGNFDARTHRTARASGFAPELALCAAYMRALAPAARFDCLRVLEEAQRRPAPPGPASRTHASNQPHHPR